MINLRSDLKRAASALLAMPVCKLAIKLFTVFLIAGAGLAGNRSGAFQAFSQVGAAARQGSEAKSAATNFEFQKLADGIYAVVRKDLPGFMVDANDVLIINDNDVVVVDTNGAPAITREVLAELKKLTNKPVRYVINTHWHDDHIRGNDVYREAFPGVEFIAHAAMRDYMPGQGEINRRNFLEGAPRFLEDLKRAVANGKSLTGSDITPEERASHQSDIRLVELVLSEGSKAPAILPTISVTERLTLHRGKRIIDIRYLGSGHTAGDLVIHLPHEGILITGDLVVWPVPLVGNPQSRIGDWASTIEKLLALRPTIIVPGHGPVMRDDSYLILLAELFTSVKKQAAAAAARGETLEEARKSINLEEFRKRFSGDSKIRKLLFQAYVAGPAVEAAYREVTGKH
ncbi:MAG: MBL fold metallo-hydrolase [Acidobacteria bacterium]|nr:MBL fold metallo-hydrolase [Acidobacteriota bacterium]